MKPKLSKRTTKAELLAELQALQLIEEEYRLLLDESSDPIFAFYPDGRYRYVNLAFADGVGFERINIIGKKIWDIFSKNEADKRFAVVKWVFENRQTRIIEVRVPRPDGDRYYVTTVKPIFDTVGAVVSVICVSKDITDRKMMEEKLAYMSQYDSLTNLPNRTLFSDRLQHAISEAIRNRTRLALLFMDIDYFKTVNDNCGHMVGDLLLQAAAQRLQTCVRKSDTVSRLGGDEFVVVLSAIEDEHYAHSVAEKIRHAMNQPFDLEGCQCQEISICIGIAIYPDHGSDEIELTRNADKAMYQAKDSGRNGVKLFQPADSSLTKN
ncbi:MAG: sensor domain-containing diguanylate cyclase [Desulfuromonadaceae bacterium]|nr:sensor domain-containing diguanylate cyclase [Desulfuromonadaceae bacterium]MDD5107305.1 sensor domain-containing diguanylate cyclase [Desulfuromonadaceae bacterium]